MQDIRLFQRLMLLVVLSMTFNYAQACWGDPSLSCAIATDVTTIEISRSPGKHFLPTDRKLSDFLGVHSLFWGVQHAFYANTPSTVSQDAINLLQSTGVAAIRYGGGVNEIDWQGCQGPISERPKQNLAPWLDPVSCIFGIQEYEALNEQLKLNSTWHIANVVGFERSVRSSSLMAADAAEYALKVRSLASSRVRYWELGNELDRSWPSWNAKMIAEKSLPVARAILHADPSAKLVLPLIEFKSEIVKDDDAHNKFLIEQFKGLTEDYALHLYYENEPWGPSVANRLGYARKVVHLLHKAGIKSPSIWITEHARPPAGTPADTFWKNNWYQTNNHDAVIATADFLIGLMQIPEVKGAFWHGLRAGPWNYIELDNDKLLASNVAKLFGIFKPPEGARTLQTKTVNKFRFYAPMHYAVRSSAFMDQKNNIWLWIVNRDQDAQVLQLTGDAIHTQDLRLEQTLLTETKDGGVVSKQVKVIKAADINNRITIPGRAVAVVKLQTGHK